MDAGNVTGGGDDATFAAADDHRLVGKLRIVAFFHGGVKGVTVDMRERQVIKLFVAREARAAANMAAAQVCLLLGKAVATEAGCLVRCRRHGWNKG